jgi:hypothetical protein
MYMAYHSKTSDITVTLEGRGSYVVELKWNLVSGREEVVSLSVTTLSRDQIVEPVILREIPFTSLIRSERQRRTQKTQTSKRPVKPENKPRTRITDEHLRHVASLYMQAWRNGLPVQRYVADALRVAVPTAARQITLARERGYISNDINPKRN